MNLRQLGYFVAVAEELSFSRAATRVHISQPPLSRQVARLEGELGVRLLHRTTHAVTLTEAGQAFLAEARQMLSLATRAGHAARRAARGETGHLRVGFIGSALYSSLPRLLRQYRQRYPEVELSLTQLTIAKQADALRNREIDLGIIRQYLSDDTLAMRRLVKEPFVVALPLGHPLAKQKKIMLQSLAEEDFVVFSREDAPVVHQQMLQMCERAGYRPRVVQEARPMATVVGLVAAGLGVAIVPESMQRINIEHVVYRTLGGTRACNEYVIAWHRENRSPALAGFMALV